MLDLLVCGQPLSYGNACALDFDFILENEKLKNKMKGQKVRVIVLTLAN